MCGIAGIAGEIFDQRLIPSMLDVMNHRGPDSSGFFFSENVHLGHCRLAINDLSENANQPFIDQNQNLAVLVNGEIYNYRELRKPLANAGYKFKSSSDSEIVLQGYAEYGLDIINHLNGMFAIAIWDGRKKELFLIRDRLGIKPVYYTKVNQSFLFASEIKALSQYDKLDLSMDMQSFSEYLVFENYFSNRTLNKNIKLVEPGEIITFTCTGARLKRKYFWRPVIGQQTDAIDENIYERYRSILKSSIRRHLISDVPVGFYLSSGIDSSSVVYYSSKFLKKKLETYTGSFGMTGFYDEATDAQKIAEEYGCTNNRINIIPKDFNDHIEDVLWHLDEPRVGMGSFSQYMVARQAARDVKVILTGHGGDEFFAGYPVFKAIYGKKNTRGLIFNSSFRELLFALYFIVFPRFRKEAGYFLPNIYSQNLIRQTLNSDFLTCLTKETDALQELKALKFECKDEYEQLTNTYLKHYLPALFVVEDKISMAFSLESRTPLCDNEMLDLALSIPLSMKLLNQELKHIPRTAMRNKLPGFIFNLPKRGFPTPLRYWFKNELGKYIRMFILDNMGMLNMFKAQEVERLIYRFQNSTLSTPLAEIAAHRLWVLLNLIIYFKNQRCRYKRA
jgi:asparagine synthase (glutamine-hydrolysing)